MKADVMGLVSVQYNVPGKVRLRSELGWGVLPCTSHMGVCRKLGTKDTNTWETKILRCLKGRI